MVLVILEVVKTLEVVFQNWSQICERRIKLNRTLYWNSGRRNVSRGDKVGSLVGGRFSKLESDMREKTKME